MQNIEKYETGKDKGKIKDKIIRCYEYFTKQIKEVEYHKDKEFLEFILNSKLWVTINLDTNEDEQKIFDSINTAGLKLTATDIIKNALFAKAMELNTDYEKLYKEYWDNLFEAKENKEFWEEEIATGRLKRVQSEIFLHAFAICDIIYPLDSKLKGHLCHALPTKAICLP